MPDSVDSPAPLSTTTRPWPTTRTTSSRLVVRGAGSPVAVQLSVGRVRTLAAYELVATRGQEASSEKARRAAEGDRPRKYSASGQAVKLARFYPGKIKPAGSGSSSAAAGSRAAHLNRPRCP